MKLPTDFQGYPRSMGLPGIRNHLTIVSMCGLNTKGARKVASKLPGAVLVSNPYGRGQLGIDKQFSEQMLVRFGTHPNTGAVLILAADTAMRRQLQEQVEAAGRPVVGFSLQEMAEDGERLIDEAVAAGRRLQSDLAKTERSVCALKDLVLAAECGHSDATSGIVANPLVGELADVLVDAGGAVVISETLEWLGTEAQLYKRCVTAETASRLRLLIEARHQIAHAAGKNVFIGNPGPQNIEGGITTLQEKSQGAIAKGGTTPIVAALAEGESITGPGLHLMDTPTLSPESISSMVASGAQLVIFTTGQGNPYASAIAPTLKLTANPETAARLPRQIDFDASSAFSGTSQHAELLLELVELVTAICNGQLTAAERLDEGDELISRLGLSI